MDLVFVFFGFWFLGLGLGLGLDMVFVFFGCLGWIWGLFFLGFLVWHSCFFLVFVFGFGFNICFFRVFGFGFWFEFGFGFGLDLVFVFFGVFGFGSRSRPKPKTQVFLDKTSAKNDIFQCCSFVEFNKTNEVKFWLTVYSYFDVSMIMVIIITVIRCYSIVIRIT